MLHLVFEIQKSLSECMSSEGIDCARLVDSLLKSDISSAARNLVDYSNDDWSPFASTDDFSDLNTTTLYMDEYFGTFVDFKLLNDPLFWRWFVIIAVCIVSVSVLFSCVVPCHMARQKRIALRVLEDRGLMTRRKWLLFLDEYTNGQHVLDTFAGVWRLR